MITMLNRGSVALLLVLLAWDGGSANAQAPSSASVETAVMTPKQQLEASRVGIERMRGMIGQMQDLLRKAQERGDAEGEKCVRDKLASGRAAVQVSVLARNAMQEALASNNPGRAGSEFRKVEAAGTMVDQFLAEAMACLAGGSDTTSDVLRDSSGDVSADNSLGDLGSVIDIGDEGPQFTPHQ